MGPYRRRRIDKGGTILDLQSVDGVRVVAAPDLRRIVEHSRVEASAAAAASLDQDIRIALHDPLQEIIQPQHIVVKDSSLAVRRSGIDISDTPVHIPLDIFHVALIEHSADLLINIVYNFFS